MIASFSKDYGIPLWGPYLCESGIEEGYPVVWEAIFWVLGKTPHLPHLQNKLPVAFKGILLENNLLAS